jgi:membrane associated rhomboid family serine protease
VFAFVPLGFVLTSVALPAWTMLLYWMLIQTVSGVFDLARVGGGGVAFWAHIGGFLGGLLLIKLFARPELIAEHRAHHWRPRRVGFER